MHFIGLKFYNPSGDDCSLESKEGVWFDSTPEQGDLPPGRASHKSATDDSYMYVVSGESFGIGKAKVSRYVKLLS